MKKIVVLLLLLASGGIYSQKAYTGKGDSRFGIGFNGQSGGRGIQVGYDNGLGENISYGFLASYLLSTTELLGQTADFLDCFDAKARLNANLNTLIGVDALDIYPGLNIGTRNFGAHLGVRYFFTDGLGLFSELTIPIKKYNINEGEVYGSLNNQAVFVIGVAFSLM